MNARLGLAVIVVLCAARVHAQPDDPRTAERGYIGRALPDLEIDDCPPIDDSLAQAQLMQRAAERYSRGETLYIQGDYDGAVKELVGAYCGVPANERRAFYSILKDIGQAYERSLDYEKAIGYLERYVTAVPPDARRAGNCAPDPQVEKDNVIRRIEVLQKLKAHILVETNPPGARVTLQNEFGKAAFGKAGEQLVALGGKYTMIVELDRHEIVEREVEVRIGKPYTYYISLRPVHGSLSIQASPPDARVFIDQAFAGIGRVDRSLPAGRYELMVEAPGRVEKRSDIEVLPNQLQRLQVELEEKPQFGRRQLIAYATAGTATAGGMLLWAFEDPATSTLGVLGGGALGFLGSYLYLSDTVPLGTSNLTITASLAAAVGGGFTVQLLTDRSEIGVPVIGASLLAGAAAGYYIGTRTRISPGDAALINTTTVWGTTAGVLFAQSFAAQGDVQSALILSGLGMGAASGVLATRYFDVSRRRAVLIDIGAIVGMIAGVATVNLAYGNEEDTASVDEHRANFALGGMALGLAAAGFLTRNIDSPRVPVTPTLGRATDKAGAATTTYGFSATW